MVCCSQFERVLALDNKFLSYICQRGFAQEWLGVLRHRNTRELYSNNLRAVGANGAQLKTKQNRKQDNKTRHTDQNKVNR